MAMAGAFLFAQSAILTRLSGADFLVVTLLRCAYAVPFLVLLAWWESRRDSLSSRPSWRGVLAGVFFAGNLLCWNAAIGLVGAAVASVLANVQVVIVALAIWILDGKRPSRTFWIALVPIFVGALLVAGLIDGTATATDTAGFDAAGLVLCTVSACMGAGCLLALARMPVHTRGRVAVLRDMTTVTAVICAGWVLCSAGQMAAVASLTWQSHLILFLLAVSSQVVAWILLNRGLRSVSPVAAALISVAQPVITLLTAVLLLGERPGPAQYAGCLIMLAALAWYSLSSARPTRIRPTRILRTGSGDGEGGGLRAVG